MRRATRRLEQKLQRNGYRLIAGADEVGKGAWAGPLVAAAVILGEETRIPGLRDSKFLTPTARQRLFIRITKLCPAWAVEVIPSELIDRFGIQEENRRAIARAALRLRLVPDLLLVDAIEVPVDGIRSQAVPDGDSQVSAIAAASILAKVVRDELMRGFHRFYPRYKFPVHKGYGTRLHEQLLRRHGPSPIHRRSYEPVRVLVERKR